MLKMRLQRIGRKNAPTYRVVVVDSRQGVGSGKFIDMIGSYEPKGGAIRIDGDKAKEWLSKGVQASPTVHNMLVTQKVITAAKITVQAPKKEAPVVEVKVEEAPAADKADDASALTSEGSTPATEEVAA